MSRRALWPGLLLLLAAPTLAQPPLRDKLPDVVLSNGLRVMGCEDHSTNLVGVYLAVRVGAAAEPAGLSGARDVLQEMFRYNLEQQMRGQRQYLDLSSALLVGRGLDLSTEWDYVSLVTLCPRSELRALLQVIGRALFTDRLTAPALEAARRQVRLQWEQAQQNAAEATYYLFRRGMLGEVPAARPVFPDPATLARITIPALQDFRDRLYSPGNSLLTIVGPDSPDQLVAEAVEAMTSIPHRPTGGAYFATYPLRPTDVVIAQNPRLNRGYTGVASMVVGFRLPPVTDADYAAALVLYERLTGRQGLLLADTNLKAALEAAGRGYGLTAESALTVLGRPTGVVPYFAVHVQSAPEEVGHVQAALQAALYRARDEATPEPDLSRARRRAINAVALSGLDQQARARRLGEWALFARSWTPLERLPQSVSRVDQAALQRIAARCFARQYVGLQMPE